MRVTFVSKIIKQGPQKFINIPAKDFEVVRNDVGGVGQLVKVTLEKVETGGENDDDR